VAVTRAKPSVRAVYITNEGSKSVSVINPSTNTVVSTVAVGLNPIDAAVTPNGATAYVTAYLNDYRASSFTSTWEKIFATVAPLMIHELSEERLQLALNDFVDSENREVLAKHERLFSVQNFRIDYSDFQTIKIQLRALGLIVRSESPEA
jgi:YVTN family beta-propeller protein